MPYRLRAAGGGCSRAGKLVHIDGTTGLASQACATMFKACTAPWCLCSTGTTMVKTAHCEHLQPTAMQCKPSSGLLLRTPSPMMQSQVQRLLPECAAGPPLNQQRTLSFPGSHPQCTILRELQPLCSDRTGTGRSAAQGVAQVQQTAAWCCCALNATRMTSI